MTLENEIALLSFIKAVEETHFSKSNLDYLKRVPETVNTFLKARFSSDNEKNLAAQLYLKTNEKIGTFAKEVKNKQITPNEEELNACEEFVDALYNGNNELMRDASEIAMEMKVSVMQPVLSDLKKAIQQAKSEKQPKPSNGNGEKSPMTWRGFSVLLIILIMIIGFGFLIFRGVKKLSKRSK